MLPAALRGDARDLPQLAGLRHADDIAALAKAAKAHEAVEELRLGLRRVHPRPAPAVVSVVALGRPPQDRRWALAVPRSPRARRWPPGAASPTPWLDMPAEGLDQPATPRPRPTSPWPITAPHRRGRAPAASPPTLVAGGAGPTDADDARGRAARSTRSQQWDDELERLLDEARRDRSPEIEVPLPASLSATVAGPAARRPRGVRPRAGPADAAAAVAGGPVRHPLPRLGGGAVRPAARCSTPTSCPAAATSAIDDEADLRELIEALRGRRRSPTGCRTPSSRRSRWCSPGRWCAAGSTRSTPRPTAASCVVDWKTNRTADRRPAPARDLPRSPGPSCTGVPLERVRAAFYYVRTGEARRARRPAGPGRARAAARDRLSAYPSSGTRAIIARSAATWRWRARLPRRVAVTQVVRRPSWLPLRVWR